MSNDIEVIDLAQRMTLLEAAWQPRVVAAMNDVLFKIARLEGEFVWHHHDETDEAFLVVSGRLEIDLPDRTVELGPNELFVVPRGVEHRPRSKQGCQVLLIEPEGVRNTGNLENERTTDGDVWLV